LVVLVVLVELVVLLLQEAIGQMELLVLMVRSMEEAVVAVAAVLLDMEIQEMVKELVLTAVVVLLVASFFITRRTYVGNFRLR
jgi:hypothetical protein